MVTFTMIDFYYNVIKKAKLFWNHLSLFKIFFIFWCNSFYILAHNNNRKLIWQKSIKNYYSVDQNFVLTGNVCRAYDVIIYLNEFDRVV